MYHSQNLNENRRGEVIGSQFWAGRAWWSGKRGGLNWEWKFGRKQHHAHAYVEVEPQDNAVRVSLAVPWVAAIWVTLGHAAFRRLDLNRWCRRPDQTYGNPRNIGLSVHDGALWWDVWADTMEWRHNDPKWQHGAWHPIDTLLGRNEVTWIEREKIAVTIPMPEGPYRGEVEVKDRIDKRPRWFARVSQDCWLTIPGGIPHPGKGENSWDCGMDGLFGCGGDTVERAIGHAVESVLRSRERYAGSRDWMPPKAETA
jgi:hypothetical protein